MSLNISPDLSLPLSSVTWVIAYLSKRGSGKTYCASVQAEEMMRNNIPIVVIDGMSTWYGLRVKADEVSPGFPIVVFGGEHADLPLAPEKAGEIAKAVVGSGISCVLDLGTFAKYSARKIVAAFLNELYRLNRMERHVFIEESDMFAPQRPLGPEENLCLSAVDNFVRRGGNRNLGCTLITQRSAVLNKDLLTQADCLVILRTLAPQDKKAIQLWVEEQTDKEKKGLNEWYDGLKSLENGEAWVWHPEKPAIFKKINFRRRETFHATREFICSPQANKIVLMDVDEFIQKFKNVFEPKPKETPTPIPREETLTVPKDMKETIPVFAYKPESSISSSPLLRHPQETIFESNQPPKAPMGLNASVVVQGSAPESMQPIEVTQAVPNIRINQFKPSLSIPVESLNEPTTALGRVLVVLKNEPRLDRWTGNRIKEHVRNHGWDDEGVDEVVKQLIRWEILRKQSNNYLYFYSKRVSIMEDNGSLLVK